MTSLIFFSTCSPAGSSDYSSETEYNPGSFQRSPSASISQAVSSQRIVQAGTTGEGMGGTSTRIFLPEDSNVSITFQYPLTWAWEGDLKLKDTNVLCIAK